MVRAKCPPLSYVLARVLVGPGPVGGKNMAIILLKSKHKTEEAAHAAALSVAASLRA